MKTERCFLMMTLVAIYGLHHAPMDAKAGAADVLQIQPETVAIFGGSGDQRAAGIAIAGGTLHVVGYSSISGMDGLYAGFVVPLGNAATPLWQSSWPARSGYDTFSGVGANSMGIYVSGSSYSQTADLVGDKEQKGIVIRFPMSGPTAGGVGGCIWSQQTPAAPGAFTYGGYENLGALAMSFEGGTNFIYVTGWSQSGFFNGGRLYVSKLTEDSTVLWTRNDVVDQIASRYSLGLAIAQCGDGIVAGGVNSDAGSPRPYLRKYGPTGELLWSRRSTSTGQFNCVTSSSNAIFAVGIAYEGTNGMFLIERYDQAGSNIWSRIYDRGVGEDVLNGLAMVGQRLFAVGSTRTQTSGGSDAVLVEINAESGDLLLISLYGGSEDDAAFAITSDGSDIYVAGETHSFGAVGADAMLLRYSTPPALKLNMYAGLTIFGTVGARYRIEYTPVLCPSNGWSVLQTVTLPTNPYLFIDTDSPNTARRFYRAVYVP